MAGAADVPRLLCAVSIEGPVNATTGLAEAVGSADQADAALGVLVALGLGEIGRLARVVGTGGAHAEQGKHSCPGTTDGGSEQAAT